MNIVRIRNGLGNQLFQYAFGRSLTQEKKEDTLFDTSWFYDKKLRKKEIYRDFGLKHFNTHLPIATQKQINKIRGRKNRLPGFIRQFFKIARYPYLMSEGRATTGFNPDLFKLQKGYYFDGEFQNEKYFKKIRSLLLTELALKTPMNEENQNMNKKIDAVNAVSLHIRRGDYVQNNWHIETTAYHQNAIDTIVQKVKNPHFFIFSDDMKWVKKNLPMAYPHTFVNINTAETSHFDLHLMRCCKHNIVANSTFSWWGLGLTPTLTKLLLPLKIGLKK